jgi:hypothetical protein
MVDLRLIIDSIKGQERVQIQQTTMIDKKI